MRYYTLRLLEFIIFLKRMMLKIPFRLPNFVLYILQSIVYLVHYRSWIHKCKNIDVYQNRFELFKRFNVGKVNYYEFGVSDGKSFKWWLENNKYKDSKFTGYDTFEGLPENWGVFKKGDMASNIPIVNDERARFVRGLFQNVWIEYPFGKRLVYLDADLYSSTLYVLFTIKWNRGDIIIFDDFNVMAHVFRAFWDWTQSSKIKYSVIARTNNNSEIAILIEEQK